MVAQAEAPTIIENPNSVHYIPELGFANEALNSLYSYKTGDEQDNDLPISASEAHIVSAQQHEDEFGNTILDVKLGRPIDNGEQTIIADFTVMNGTVSKLLERAGVQNPAELSAIPVQVYAIPRNQYGGFTVTRPTEQNLAAD